MKTITIKQKEFDRLFTVCAMDFEHSLPFMKAHETIDVFKKTKRYEMLETFRQTLKKLKKDLEKSV